jgi:hypothetical protein
MRPNVIPATAEHCHLIAPHLRQIDKDEIWSIAAMNPLDALLYSVQDSKEALTVMMPDSDTPIMMFGLGAASGLICRKRSIWLLGTDEIRRIKKRFIMESGQYLETLAGGETVYNYVLEGNTASLRWLKMLGFTIMDAKPFGWLNKPYHYVERSFPCALWQHSPH